MAMVRSVIANADHSRPEDHSACISRQTRSGGGKRIGRTPPWVARYQAPKTVANSTTWIRRMRIRSRRMGLSPRVAGFAHARDRRPDLVAEHLVERLTDGAELVGQHEV